jgi:hypothetical protein
VHGHEAGSALEFIGPTIGLGSDGQAQRYEDIVSSWSGEVNLRRKRMSLLRDRNRSLQAKDES